MPHNDSAPSSSATGRDVLLWDLAGTLLPWDETTGRPGVLPGCDEYLPELCREFRQYVTTGDSCGGARQLLAGFEILEYFEDVYGDLMGPVGKPYGAILQAVGGDPARSLAVGDRLKSDVAADTPDVVTVLINQDGRTHNCAMVAFLVHLLRRKNAFFPAAFDTLMAGADPDPDVLGEAQGGEITAAGRRSDGLSYRLWRFEHTLLDEPRRVVVI
ncbi:MAG: HAD family hydrolase [bacterium]|nr:HAD family hydrolase [bacterium]